jgi:hypothetical protein
MAYAGFQEVVFDAPFHEVVGDGAPSYFVEVRDRLLVLLELFGLFGLFGLGGQGSEVADFEEELVCQPARAESSA